MQESKGLEANHDMSTNSMRNICHNIKLLAWLNGNSQDSDLLMLHAEPVFLPKGKAG